MAKNLLSVRAGLISNFIISPARTELPFYYRTVLVRRKILPPEAGNNCLKWQKQEYCVNTV